ncbi:response regulator transcription factor [Amphibacillus xylanus]|uniref:Putative LuxR family transcriptional regulator n=1 Tax=Amphibacillus xylanus (strain ATCC 51415 / DSM 6626 / JCM 7361 / LMG 17667 / NBRC 15112 / Ep01) TaxID=698758 RepID=K0J809_AMPXN|nr:response regulator transcription factor [Amphibacillus xylanus]BAM48298.1 putative LuxR family transcriptional regulator [Amphibacillus xylanus NBRC 15112]
MNILLVKQASLVCDGIFGLLKRHFPNSKLSLCSQYDCQEFLAYSEQANLIIVDIKMTKEVLKVIKYLKNEGKKVIAWVEDLRDDKLPEVFKLNLNGYIYYEVDEETLIKAIRQICAGGLFIHEPLSNRLLDIYTKSQSEQNEPPLELLSEREWEVLELLSKGYSNVKIANELFLSDKTVKNYVSSILYKLDVPDRTNAVLHALRKRWVSL